MALYFFQIFVNWIYTPAGTELTIRNKNELKHELDPRVTHNIQLEKQ